MQLGYVGSLNTVPSSIQMNEQSIDGDVLDSIPSQPSLLEDGQETDKESVREGKEVKAFSRPNSGTILPDIEKN